MRSFIIEHPDPGFVAALYRTLALDRPPAIKQWLTLRYRAQIETPAGLRELT